MTKMLYRFSGEHEPEVKEHLLGNERIPVEYKIFDEDEVDAAKERGWVEHGRILEFYHADQRGEQPGKDEDEDETKDEDRETSQDDNPPDMPDLSGMDEGEAKKKLKAWARDEFGIELSRRYNLENMKTQLSEALNARG